MENDQKRYPWSLPNHRGTYALVLASAADEAIRIGRLGVLHVRPGFYVYVGSAFGPGGLDARVARHQRRDKSLRWHIDYLRQVSTLQAVWYTCENQKRKCFWAGVLVRLPGAEMPMSRFGSSDCTCGSHLVYFRAAPSHRTFARRCGGSTQITLPDACLPRHRPSAAAALSDGSIV